MSTTKTETGTMSEKDLDGLFNSTPGVEAAAETNVLKSEKDDLFPEEEKDEEEDEEEENEEEGNEEENEEEEEENEEENNNEGGGAGGAEGNIKPKEKKSVVAPKEMTGLVSKLIKNNVLRPYDDEDGKGKKIEEYSMQELEELITSNFAEKEEEEMEEIRSEFFGSLPKEFQLAATYYANGGKDLKPLLLELAHVEEAREFDVTKPKDQEAIVRNYYRSINFGTADEIDEEVNSIKDRGDLEKKAQQYHPKLEGIYKNTVAKRVQEQEKIKNRQMEIARVFQENVHKALSVDSIKGIKLGRKEREMIYTGLTRMNYPTMNGRNTNRLGHLLEKFQFSEEADFGLIAEVMMLLEDREKYHTTIKNLGASGAAKKTFKTLKNQEQSRRTGTSVEQGGDNEVQRKKALKRPAGSFFRRE